MRKLYFIVLLFCSMCIFAQNQNDTVKNNRDSLITVTNEIQQEMLLQAIINIESNGNPNAISKDGSCVGILQIKKVVVNDCNEYLKSKGKKKRYSYKDRLDSIKSKEMFYLIEERYRNYKRYRSSSLLEHSIRLWNGGCNYSKHKTQTYFKKVINEYNKLKKARH